MNSIDDKYYLSPESPIRSRSEKYALIAGIVGLAASLVGYFVDPGRFFFSYLTAFAFWITIALGALFFVMLHHLTSATWSVVIRKQAEAFMSILPYLIIFVIPVILGIKHLYQWSHPEVVAVDHVLQHKSSFLNIPFFIIRIIIYFAVWTFLSYSLLKVSARQDQAHSKSLSDRMRKISAPGMILFAFTITYASFDWLMSQDSHWYSTIFGVYIFAGGLVSMLAYLTYTSLNLRAKGILPEVITEEHYHDLGKLTFSFLVFWAYVAFSQYLLIWYANLPEETIWFAGRYHGSWKVVTILIAVGYFSLPFVLLMSRGTKRKLKFMKIMVLWLLFMHWIDLYWIIMPNLNRQNAMIHWVDIATMLGIGGIFMWLFWRKLFSGPLVPINDPRLRKSIEFINY